MTNADKLRDILELTDCSRGQWEPLLDALVAERDEAVEMSRQMVAAYELAGEETEAAEAELVEWKATVNVLMGERTATEAEVQRLREALEAEQRDKGFALAEVERLGVLLSETEGERVGWKDRAEAAEAEVARLREAADAAMHELGVPQDHLTPAPVGNAYEILRAALSAPDTKEKGA